jgi:hypothetical protein
MTAPLLQEGFYWLGAFSVRAAAETQRPYQGFFTLGYLLHTHPTQ